MADGGKFESLIQRLPMDEDSVIGNAVSWFIKKQEPEEVNFTRYENGYKIEVYTDKGDAEEAQGFWEENVAPHLGDNK